MQLTSRCFRIYYVMTLFENKRLWDWLHGNHLTASIYNHPETLCVYASPDAFNLRGASTGAEEDCCIYAAGLLDSIRLRVFVHQGRHPLRYVHLHRCNTR